VKWVIVEDGIERAVIMHWYEGESGVIAEPKITEYL
jgi:hypothetical protein